MGGINKLSGNYCYFSQEAHSIASLGRILALDSCVIAPKQMAKWIMWGTQSKTQCRWSHAI